MKNSPRPLILAISILVTSIFATAEKTDPSTQPSTPTPTEVPIIIVPKKDLPQIPTPPKRIEALMHVTQDALWFDLPFEDYPISATVESMSGFGYWTATFTDTSSCEIPFNGPVGDYRLTLTTADNSSYTGLFSLE